MTSGGAGLLVRGPRLGPDGDRHDVLVRCGRIVAVGSPASAAVLPRDVLVDGGEAMLLPGLVDHHLHLGAWLRSRRSIPVRPEGVVATLDAVPADRRGWRVLFGFDHQDDLGEAMAAVDAVSGPCLVVHRTGHACVLNGPAAVLLGAGRTTRVDHGRGLWGRALGPADPHWEKDQLARLARDLLAEGVVAVQDATPYPAAAAARCRDLRRAMSPVRVDFMSDPASSLELARWTKVLSVRERPAQAHRPLAVHAVEPEEIVAALELLGSSPPAGSRRHRIEHASLCPPALVERVAAADVLVCANPGFLLERSSAFRLLARSGEGEFLHPVAELRDAGVPVLFGSDAPVTRPGVWAALDALRERGGPAVPFAGAAVPVAAALDAVTSFPLPASPEGWVGRPADLALVDGRRFTGPTGAAPALAVFVSGEPVFRR